MTNIWSFLIRKTALIWPLFLIISLLSTSSRLLPFPKIDVAFWSLGESRCSLSCWFTGSITGGPIFRGVGDDWPAEWHHQSWTQPQTEDLCMAVLYYDHTTAESTYYEHSRNKSFVFINNWFNSKETFRRSFPAKINYKGPSLPSCLKNVKADKRSERHWTSGNEGQCVIPERWETKGLNPLVASAHQ